MSDASDIRQARENLAQCAGDVLDTRWIGITRPPGENEFSLVAATADVVQRAGQIERHLRAGPGFDALAAVRPVVSDDLIAELRWPGYSQAMTSTTAVRSVLALPLEAGGSSTGTLMAYSARAFHFADKLHDIELLATHAGTALASVSGQFKAANLEVALQTNREIAMALGIVMNRLRLTQDQSFAYLRDVSQRRHLKLNEVASRIVMTGEIPAVPPPAVSPRRTEAPDPR